MSTKIRIFQGFIQLNSVIVSTQTSLGDKLSYGNFPSYRTIISFDFRQLQNVTKVLHFSDFFSIKLTKI